MNLQFTISSGDGVRRIYCRYRPNRETDIKKASPFKINAELWDNKKGFIKKSARKNNPRTENDQRQTKFIDELSSKLMKFSTSVHTLAVSKMGNVTVDDFENLMIEEGWMSSRLSGEVSTIPENIAGFFDYHIKEVEEENLYSKRISSRTIMKYRTIRNHLQEAFPKLKISEVGNDFMKQYKSFRKDKDIDTVNKELSIIRQFIKEAQIKKIPINDEVLNWRLYKKKREYPFPTLSFSELQKIKDLELHDEHLLTARDWLLIGCNVGLRVSDLLKLTSDNLEEGNTVYYTQRKTGMESGAILYGDAAQIVNEYDGHFPRRMSDQKFNLHIKKLCELAKINEAMTGGLRIMNRLVVDTFPKYELVTSHICRRSFVSNYIGMLGPEVVQFNTGHQDMEMLRLYDQRNLRKKSEDIRAKMRVEGFLN